MPLLPFLAARANVVAEMAAIAARPAVEPIDLTDGLGRVLADPATADRDQPPFDRSTRDGFAVRSSDVSQASRERPVTLRVVGEIAAGGVFSGQVGSGQAVEIMTGASRPAGADAIVMVEHCERQGADVLVKRAAAADDNVVLRGSELAQGAVALAAGQRLDPSRMALLASLGVVRPRVFIRPRVAIVSTGDELVEAHATPGPQQIRNSNRHALAGQIALAGAVPVILPIVRDARAAMATAIERAFAEADLVCLSGGVSAGKYDFVEGVLADHGARFVFDAVAIRPGKPLVFGFVGRCPFFGLPGNPLSTLVTFSLFVTPAIDVLAGGAARPLLPKSGVLGEDYRQTALTFTAFVPARLADPTGDLPAAALVFPIVPQGSGDLGAMARAQALLVVPPGTTQISAGSPVLLLPK